MYINITQRNSIIPLRERKIDVRRYNIMLRSTNIKDRNSKIVFRDGNINHQGNTNSTCAYIISNSPYSYPDLPLQNSGLPNTTLGIHAY